MARLFGTDGVRGVANRDLTPDLALALGRAAGLVLAPGGGRVVVGRDTRLSGPMLHAALTAGLCSAGASVLGAGILPTPGVAWLTRREDAAAGAVISASHNPVPDNGIKFFSAVGTKVSADEETSIEELLAQTPDELPTGEAIGGVDPVEDGASRYVEHLLTSIDGSLGGLRVVVDCAYGAAFAVGPEAFRRAGAEVVALHDSPDGARINVDCGSTSLDTLAKVVVSEGAAFGVGFDGDADRALAVDETGAVIDGDRIIALAALHLKERGELDGGLVVTTVMANLGLRRALEAAGIEVVTVPVGDRFVAEAMTEHGAVIGGEQSGHVIFAEHATTGDGVLTGLKLAEIVAASGRPLSDLAAVFEPYPQVLLNVRIADRGALEGAAEVWERVRAAEESLGESGRVLVRASGTEPLVRVMVEAEDPATADRVARDLAALVESK
ncbi:MAG TPA: phosphoglucosamine mutase, partial [Actinomycetota bacterium]|nr:phosphoglucosamine mutase [Actinomycetota bacterium]